MPHAHLEGPYRTTHGVKFLCSNILTKPPSPSRSRSSFTRKCGRLCGASAKKTRLEASPQRRQTLETFKQQRSHVKSGSELEPDATRVSAGLCSAIAFPLEVQEDDGKISEPLCHMDYAVDVWRQIAMDWEAGGALLWTLGNGMGALAAIKDELPAW